MGSRIKPYGLSLLGTLAILAALLLMAGGLSLASGLGTGSEGPLAVGIFVSLVLGYAEIAIVTQQFTLVGVTLLVLAVVYFLVAIGLFLNRQWAWALSIGLATVGIVSNLIQIAVLGPIGVLDWIALLIAIGALIYLTRPRVRSFFHRTRIITVDEP